ncbi:MAG: hypothetical protein R3Y47_09660 [Lachnospiraceae bacterium]
MEALQVYRSYTVVLIVIFLFALTCLFWKYLQEQKALLEHYKEFRQELQKHSHRMMNYKRKKQYLDRMGASYYLGRCATPIWYSFLQYFLALLMFLALLSTHVLYAVVGSTAMYFILDLYLWYKNKTYNQEITKELKIIYATLAVQVQAGVQIVDAVTNVYECLEGDKNRLKDAFLDLSSSLIVYGEIDEALTVFQSKFDNRYIDTLCVILKQALESGLSIDLFRDVSEQLKDLEAALLLKKKGGLDRSLTMYQMVMMVAILGVAIYATMSEMLVSLNFN